MKKQTHIAKGILKFVGWFMAGLWALYLFGAFYFDMKLGLPAGIASVIFLAAMVSIIIFLKGQQRTLYFLGSCALITALWLTKKPSNDRDWVDDKAVLAYAEFDGDLVTIYNMRDAAYPEPFVSVPEYVDRTIDLSKIVGLDLFNSYWGMDLISHPMLSWRFENDESFTISIENRNIKNSEGWSELAGLYRKYELIYVVCTDRDAILRRTMYDPDDEIYMYMLDVSPQGARKLLVNYLNKVNKLYNEPEWYHLLRNNCTNTIRVHELATQDFPMPWHWGILFPGLFCKSIYKNEGMVSDLPYEEIARRGKLNETANRIGRTDDFWIQIRKDIPGFENYFDNMIDITNHK